MERVRVDGLRSIGSRLALSIVSLLLLLGTFELGLYAVHVYRYHANLAAVPPAERAIIASDDPALLFGFNPGWARDGFSVNRFGMADEEVEPKAAAGTRRVAIFGDSLTANFLLEPREVIYPTLLERMLQEAAREARLPLRFETLNFGVNGYSLLQSLRMAQLRVPVFEPEAIVVQVCLNDPVPSEMGLRLPPPRTPLRTLDFVLRRVAPERFWAYDQVDGRYSKQGWQDLERAFDGFARLAQGRILQAVLFPYLDPRGYRDWGYGALHERIGRIARERGVPLLDLRADFEAHGLLDRRWPQDPIHPGAAGHALAARRLFEALRAQGLLRPGPS